MSPTPAFTLDRFQREAIAHLDDGVSVLVCAPTGAGKTVVADHAVDRARAAGQRAFYTTPIKALSNQKFRDLRTRLGPDAVGLLTGDNSVNADADVIVMTTEVLRNMLYEGRELGDLGIVVLDEIHYLQDPFRGPVWEEVILHLPHHVTLVSLSATVSNSDELGGWLRSVRGHTETVVETTRPVELTNLYAVGERRRDRLHVIPTLLDGRPNPDGHRFDPPPRRGSRDGRGRTRERPAWRAPSRLELLDHLEERDLLPVIWFVFSRKGCDEAAAGLVRNGVRFTTPDEADRLRVIAHERLRGIDPADLELLGTDAWVEQVCRGVASHHAGLVPACKETVEVGFAEGLIRVVFATETLALGVNLPARSVVIDKLTKFTGEHHEMLTPAEFTQLTGRAGRRGIDARGHAVVPWSPFSTFDQVASLAASRSYRLRSAFRPTYNMAVNLLQHRGPDEVRAVLARSFAQYQTDAEVVRLRRRLDEARRRADELRGTADDRGTDAAVGPAPTPEEIRRAVDRLRPGDVVLTDDGGRAAVIGIGRRKGGRARLRLVDERGAEHRWDSAGLTAVPDSCGRIELPEPMAPERRGYRNEVARRVRTVRVPARRRARHAARRGPGRPRALEEAEQEIARLERRHRRDRGAIARRFDAVSDVLRHLGYLDEWEVTDRGRLLARLHHEADLLVTDALLDGVFDGLEPPALASVVSCCTYEHRSPEPAPDAWFPSAEAARRAGRLRQRWHAIERAERNAKVPVTRAPDDAFAPFAHAWAAGEDLTSVLEIDDLVSAGDFVRNIKQLVDLLRQLGEFAPVPSTARSARQAADALHRGVVAVAGALEGT